jgi:hypothetical protein
MKVKTEAIEQTQEPNRQVNIDELVQAQVEKVKQAEHQLTFEQGKLRMLLELITPPQMTRPEPTTTQ